jgi:septal ring factor EnvC (AmiA/AmiB activator)
MAQMTGYPISLPADRNEAFLVLQGVGKPALIEHCLSADQTLADKMAIIADAMIEHREMTEKLENATMMLTARGTELDRSQKIAAEMSATVAKQRDEISSMNSEINAQRQNINDLKKLLRASEMTVANLHGRLDRVQEADRLRLTAMGRQPDDPGGRNLTDLLTAVGRQRDDVDWVTF